MGVGTRLPKAELDPPSGLRVSRFDLDQDEYLVLSYPTRPLRLPADFTPAEREVTIAILHGFSNREIADARQVAVRTVANQVAAVFKKLDVCSRIELVRKLSG